MIPDGYEGVFDDPARASTAARVDYPLVYTVDRDASSITFRVTKNGERFWVLNHIFWDRPFWNSVTWYRISLIAHGEKRAICDTGWVRPATGDVTEAPCKFKVKDYLSKPLGAMLDFWAGGDEKEPPKEDVPAFGEVDRLYYLIPKN